MAGRIKGITVEIGGDTTGLDKALKGVNGTIRSTQSSLRDVNRLLKLDPKNTTLLSQKQKLLKDSINATKEKLDSLKEAQVQAKQQLENGELGQDKYDALQREIAETEAQLKRLEQEAQAAESKLAKMAEVGAKMQQTGDSIAGAGKKLMPVSGAVAGLGAISVKTAADFDSAMSKVAAVSGATGDDFDKLRAKAREMGSKTKFSASEAAEAMNYMAMAGWKTEDMLSGVEGIMNLAAASGEDLATTSDIVTDALTAFGLTAKDSGHFADILAAASSNANTNVGMMGETFKYAAPVAGALGFSAEDTAQAIGLMANAGIKSSQAGTSLRSVMTNLSKDFTISGEKIGDVTIATTNADGSMRSLNGILADSRKAFAGLSESEQAAAAKTLVGKNAMSGFLALMNSSPKDVAKLEGAIAGCDGAAEGMAETMQDNLIGQITILKSQLQELAISFGDALMPMIRNVVSHIQAFIDRLNQMSEGQRNAIIRIGMFVAALGPMLLIIGTLISKVGIAIQGFTKLAPVFAKVSGAVSKAGGAMGILGKAFSFLISPIGIVIGVVAVLAAAFAHLWKTNEKFRKTMTAIWNRIKDSVGTFVADIKTRFSGLGTSFSGLALAMKKIWEGFCKVLAPLFEGGFKVVAAVLQTVLNTVIGVLDVFIGVFTGDWKKVWQGVKTIFSSVWAGIKGILTTALGTIRKVVATVLSWLGTNWKKIWNGIKTATSKTWNSMKNTARSVFNGIKTAVLTPIKGAKAALASVWSSIRSATTAVWRGLRSTASSVWNSIKTAVTNPIRTVKSTLSSLWNGIKSTASSVWNSIKNAMISPIESAKSKISGIVSKIKGFFPLSVGRIFTGLKLPHISVSGGKAPFGIGGKGSLPSFSVSWYAKAMEKGMILDRPTIFGAMNGKLLGAGEAGSETVVGTDALMNMITSAVSGIGDDIAEAFIAATKMQTRCDVNIHVEVNGAENPEEWGKRLVRQMKLEMRTV